MPTGQRLAMQENTKFAPRFSHPLEGCKMQDGTEVVFVYII
jgi:hypothetical protein